MSRVTTRIGPFANYPFPADHPEIIPDWETGAGAIDEAGDFMYVIDPTSQPTVNGSRIIRMDLATGELALWLSLPAFNVSGSFAMTFSHSFASLLVAWTNGTGCHLYSIDFGTQAVTLIDEGFTSTIGQICRDTTSGQFICQTNRYLSQLIWQEGDGGITWTEIYLPQEFFTDKFAIDDAGAIYRGQGPSGGSTQGPLITHPAGKRKFTQILGGRFYDGASVDTVSGVDALLAKLKARGLQVSAAGEQVYFCDDGNRLKVIEAGVIDVLDGSTAEHAFEFHRGTNRLVIKYGGNFYIWH